MEDTKHQETKKKYNSTYYAKNAETIKTNMRCKVQCPKCMKEFAYSSMHKHKKICVGVISNKQYILNRYLKKPLSVDTQSE
jgi:hypothetical protein